MSAADDIIEWSSKRLAPWRQDALRRLACASQLDAQDEALLLELVKHRSGFTSAIDPPEPIPLNEGHLSFGNSSTTLRIKSIRGVKNVNRLALEASLQFHPTGMTIIYGRNGSGKSGFVRIFRTACRTRIDSPSRLRVLGNVYDTGAGDVQEAEIVLDGEEEEVVVPWTGGAPASKHLSRIAVFDSGAAQFYVDAGSQIQFLPFGLALPYKLNELCLTLRQKLEIERKPVTDQLALATILFEVPRTTKAQLYYNSVSSRTSDAEINAAAAFGPDEEKRLVELNHLLAANVASAADVSALATWTASLAAECDNLAETLDDKKLSSFIAMKQRSAEARAAAQLKAADLFSNEPLAGVGTDTWRMLWQAARDYSVGEAYPDRNFPVVDGPPSDAICVLCHQALSSAALGRMARFQEYVVGALGTAAARAESDVAEARAGIPKLEIFSSKIWPSRLEQVRARRAELATALSKFKVAAESRRAMAVATLEGTVSPALSPAADMGAPATDLLLLASDLQTEAAAITQADKASERALLMAEREELIDLKALAANRDRLMKRRDLQKEDGLYAAALAEVQTKGITQKANELVEAHLTKAVCERFDDERQALEISHLKIGLIRKSDQTKAAFQTDPGTTLTKVTSDILSEGEQRALALAAFLTEVSMNEGTGPIVVDDPVSSLDRDRGLKVASRLAEEAKTRQVIVFTHDLIFFNQLCQEADARDVESETVSLFSDSVHAGKVDPIGVTWMGLPVSKRLGRIKNDFAKLRKLNSESPSDYEYQLKNLYGRMRDTYERLVEECIFCDVIRRGVDRVETQKLRMVHLTDALAIRFHEGMTKANTFSHDNPASQTVTVPQPAEFEADLLFIEQLINDLKSASAAAEANRPSMKLKKG